MIRYNAEGDEYLAMSNGYGIEFDEVLKSFCDFSTFFAFYLPLGLSRFPMNGNAQIFYFADFGKTR